MVRGIDVFLAHFRNFSDRYALIGGTACDMAMNEAGLDFRATKDLDIVIAKVEAEGVDLAALGLRGELVEIIAGLADAYHCAPLTDTPSR